jgi:CDP-diacylglycerol--glycerol-3-phosphate 3-phosphatidyltransferase
MKKKRTRSVTQRLSWIPWGLTTSRIILSPLLIFLAWKEAPGWSLGLVLAVAFLSDIFDGVIARRLGTATASLRQYDSFADVFFYLGVIASAFIVDPSDIRARWPWLAIILLLEAAMQAVGYFRFEKLPANHTYSSKFWGILLFTTSLALLAFHRPEPFLSITLGWGILCEMEGVFIQLLLHRWKQDIPGLWSLYQRKER